MPIGHVKSNTISDMTGTVTVYDSGGNTQSVAATNLVRPSDWNSNHNIVYNLSGNTLGSSQVSGLDVTLVGGNNITFSANTAASQLVVSAANQTNQTIASGNIAGVGTTFSGTNVSGSMTVNSNGINLALSAGAGGGGNTANTFYFAGNTTNSSSGTLPQSSFAISAAGALTGGYSASSLVLSVPSQTQLTYSGNVSLASAGSTLTIIGVGAGTGYTSTTQAGSTAGITQSTNGLSIAWPIFITTAMQSQSSSAFVQTSQSSLFMLTANGTSKVGTGSTFAGTNVSGSMTLNSNGVNLALSAGAGGGGSVSLYGSGNTGTASSGSSGSASMVFSGAGAVTVGISSNTVIFSAPNAVNISQTGPNIAVAGSTITSGTVVFSNSNGISFGLNGQTMTASAGGVSAYEPFILAGTTLTSYGQASVYLQPFSPTDNVVMSNLTMLASINATTSTTSQGVTETMRYGLYSQVNSTSFSLLGSSSIVFIGTHTSTGAAGYTLSNQTSNWTSTSSNSAIYTQITGQKVFQAPFATTLADGGQYVLAFQISTSAAGASSAHRISRVALNNMTNGSWGAILNTAPVISSASVLPPFALGVLNATQTALPTSYAGSQLSQNSNLRHYFVVGT